MTDLDEPISLEDYNPTWPMRFTKESDRLRQALGHLIIDIEHIGSTAVPGQRAKPIVDILVGVQTLSACRQYLAVLKRLGYHDLGEAGVPGRIDFRKRVPDAFNVHLVEFGGLLWKDNLILRDYLRAYPEEADRYGKHKEEIIRSGATTLLRYSDLKQDFLSDLMERARRWRREH